MIQEITQGLIKDLKSIRKFVFAGNALFTLRNKVSGNQFTFKVVKQSGVYSRHYLSTVFLKKRFFTGVFYFGANITTSFHCRSNKPEANQAVAVLKWFASYLINNTPLPPQVEFWHEGKCGRCGRALTDPESIKLGIGPKCRTKI